MRKHASCLICALATLLFSSNTFAQVPAPPSDFVICNDVLGYLSKKAVREAVKNLACLTTSALYLSVLTEEDQAICDQEHTDPDQKIRPAQWYKDLFDKYFVGVSGGLFLKKPLAYPVWQMERT